MYVSILPVFFYTLYNIIHKTSPPAFVLLLDYLTPRRLCSLRPVSLQLFSIMEAYFSHFERFHLGVVYCLGPQERLLERSLTLGESWIDDREQRATLEGSGCGFQSVSGTEKVS